MRACSRKLGSSLATPMGPHHFFLELGFLLPGKAGGTDWACPEFLVMHELQKFWLCRIQRVFPAFLGGMTPERVVRSRHILRAGFITRVPLVGIPTPQTHKGYPQKSLCQFQVPSLLPDSTLPPPSVSVLLMVTQVVAVSLLHCVPAIGL